MAKGESTEFTVSVIGFESLAQVPWNGGLEPDLVDLARLRLFAGPRPPSANQLGFVLLGIQNASEETISIDKSKTASLR